MPTNDDPTFGHTEPSDPGTSLPNPWDHAPQEEAADDGGQGSHLGRDLAAGAIQGAADVAGAAFEGVGTALEVLGGCGEGCAGCSCSLAVLVTLFAAAGTAMAFFR